MTATQPSTADRSSGPSAASPSSPAAPPVVDALAVEHLCDLVIDFHPMTIYPSPYGTRVDAIARQGRIDGPRLQGEILPGGGDWIVVGRDGIARLDIKATIRTADEAIIHLTSTGRVAYNDGALDRFLAGETVGPDDIYGRTAPLFETGSEAHHWLNRVAGVGVIVGLSLQHIHYQAYTLV